MTNSPDPVPTWARWLMPSMEDLLFLLLLVWLLGSYGPGLMRDADTGMHIRTGEYILHHLTIPKEDLFSYTNEGQPWIVQSWLSAVLFALMHRWLGLGGVVLLSAIVISFTFVLLLRLLLRREVDFLTAVILVVLAASASLFSWNARPQIFTTLMALIWYGCLDQYTRDGRSGRLIFLPLLMVLWVNLHAGYLAGFILLVIFLAGELLNLIFLQDPTDKAQARRRAGAFAISIAACLMAALINPYGYEILLFPFRLMSSSYVREAIAEWIPPSFHHFYIVPFELMILLLVVGLGCSIRKTTFAEMGLILFWCHAALSSLRHIPIFAVIIPLIVGPQLTSLSKSVQTTTALHRFYTGLSGRLGRLNQSFDRHLVALLVVLSLLGLTIVSRSVGGIDGVHSQFNSNKLPVNAATFIQDVGFSGNMFNPNEFGGYLIYRLFPDYKVFVDGRVDMYGDAFMKQYASLEDLKPGWRDVLDTYHVNWIICHTYYKLTTLLSTARDWKLIYSDGTASIFVRDVPENQDFIHRFPDVQLAPRRESDASGGDR